MLGKNDPTNFVPPETDPVTGEVPIIDEDAWNLEDEYDPSWDFNADVNEDSMS